MYGDRPGSFVERVHQHSGSTSFLVGITLFTLGSILNQIMSFSILSIITLILAALPIIGFWLAFAAARTPRLPERTLPALTLFKVTVIIVLVAICLVTLMLLIIALAMLIGASALNQGFYYGSGIMVIVGIVLLVFIAIMIVFTIVYYRAILGIIGGIRNGILYNTSKPLRGVGVFSVLAYIGAGCAVLFALASIATSGAANEVLYSLPSEYWSLYEPVMDSLAGGTALSVVFTAIYNIGTVICVTVLRRFNNSLIYYG